MKLGELMPQLAAALATNTTCRELNLAGCGVNDVACQQLAEALGRNNTLCSLNLENNKVDNNGAIAIARALAGNRGLMLLNLLNQKGSRFGDSTLTEYLTMFDTNVTLLKIIWRLESRQSFRAHRGLNRRQRHRARRPRRADASPTRARHVRPPRASSARIRHVAGLTKMLTRNNEIDRLIQTGKDYADKLPAGVAPLSRDLIHQRAEVGMMMGTPRSQVYL